jgi:hypothetical protein
MVFHALSKFLGPWRASFRAACCFSTHFFKREPIHIRGFFFFFFFRSVVGLYMWRWGMGVKAFVLFSKSLGLDKCGFRLTLVSKSPVHELFFFLHVYGLIHWVICWKSYVGITAIKQTTSSFLWFPSKQFSFFLFTIHEPSTKNSTSPSASAISFLHKFKGGLNWRQQSNEAMIQCRAICTRTICLRTQTTQQHNTMQEICKQQHNNNTMQDHCKQQHNKLPNSNPLMKQRLPHRMISQ